MPDKQQAQPIKQAVSLPSSPRVHPLSNATSAPCIKSSERDSVTDDERDPMDPWEWKDDGPDTGYDDSWVRDGLYFIDRLESTVTIGRLGICM